MIVRGFLTSQGECVDYVLFLVQGLKGALFVLFFLVFFPYRSSSVLYRWSLRSGWTIGVPSVQGAFPMSNYVLVVTLRMS